MSSSGACDWCNTIGTVPDGEWGSYCTRCGRLLLIPLGRRDRYIGLGDIPEILISRVDKKVVLMKYEGHQYIIDNYTIARINGQTVCSTLRVYHRLQKDKMSSFVDVTCSCGEIGKVPVEKGICLCLKQDCRKILLVPAQPGKKYVLVAGKYYLVDERVVLINHGGTDFVIASSFVGVVCQQWIHDSSNVSKGFRAVVEAYKKQKTQLVTAHGQIRQLTQNEAANNEKIKQFEAQLTWVNKVVEEFKKAQTDCEQAVTSLRSQLKREKDERELAKETHLKLLERINQLETHNAKLLNSMGTVLESYRTESDAQSQSFNLSLNETRGLQQPEDEEVQQRMADVPLAPEEVSANRSGVAAVAGSETPVTPQLEGAFGNVSIEQNNPTDTNMAPSSSGCSKKRANNDEAPERKKMREETGEAVGSSSEGRKRKTLRLKAPVEE